MYKFDFIENIENFEKYKIDFINLLNKSIDDDAVLGFSKKIELEEHGKAYLEEIKNNLRTNSLAILVGIASENNKIISTCQIKKSLSDNTKHIADLQKGIIDPEYRGSSLLSTTLHEISSYCLKNGMELLTLDVRENTPAHKIWLRYGFRVYGILEDYSRFNEKKYNGIYMAQMSKDLYSFTQSIIK